VTDDLPWFTAAEIAALELPGMGGAGLLGVLAGPIGGSLAALTGIGDADLRSPTALPATHPGKFNITRLATVLEEVHERLAGVVIERLPYQELIPRYDRPGTLFYLDPPYWGCEGVYGKELFSREDFTRLAALLRGIRGRFLMSLNDHPGVRGVFTSFPMEVVETTYAMGYRTGRETQRVRELIISGPS
jgi:DNA adenine methylase